MIHSEQMQVRRSIAQLAAAVAAVDDSAPFVSADCLAMLDGLGFGRISSEFAEGLESDPDDAIDDACEAIQPLGVAVTLPVLAALSQVAKRGSGVSSQKFELLGEITARLCSKPGVVRLAWSTASGDGCGRLLAVVRARSRDEVVLRRAALKSR
jgi:hypothetical protein